MSHYLGLIQTYLVFYLDGDLVFYVPFNISFKSYRDDGRVIMKSSVQ